MNKRLGLIGVAATAALAAVMLACGGETPGSNSCTADTDCAATEICHPDAKVCVTTCTSGADCSDEAKNCAAISSTDSRTVCQCVTDQLCQGGTLGTNSVCSTAFKVCMNKCAANTDCPSGYDCDTATGQCTGGGGGNCDPACTGNQVCDPSNNTCVDKCTWKTDCGAGKACNETSGVCEAGATCNAANQQPDTCSYGQFCSGGSCDYVPAVDPATCSNFSGKAALNWSPATGTGPIIYSVTKESQDTGWCTAGSANPKNVRVRVKAYNKNGTFASTVKGNQGFFYVKVAGTESDATALVRDSGYTVSADSKQAEFLVNFCIPDTQTNLQIGLYFTNGNPFCGDFQQP